jgi:hypothetical protein
MKTVMVLIFSLLLAVAPCLSAQAALACAVVTKADAKPCSCCPEGVAMPCCAEKPATTPPAAPVAIAPTGASLPLLILQPAFAIVALPEIGSSSISFAADGYLMVTATPLFQRNCVLLI